MAESSLENITPPNTDCAFPNLRLLVLNRTMLKSWRDIEALNSFPNLRDVRLIGIPLLEGYSEKHGRQLSVANLPNIEKLNNTKITKSEREDAESMFIRDFMDSEKPPKRYSELVEAHGVLERLADVDLAPKETALVEILLEDAPSVNREISLTQTVLEFKKSLVDVVGVPASGFKLFYRDGFDVHPRELHRISNNSFLHRFMIKDGDSFLIQKTLKHVNK